MPEPETKQYISKIVLPSGSTEYELKDLGAREMIEHLIDIGLKFHKSTSASDTPIGVVWVNEQGQTITGTLLASDADHSFIFLVPEDTTPTGKSIYAEYITVDISETSTPDWQWELLGNTDINIDDLGDLAWKDTVTLNKGSGDVVLGASTTFTNSASAVTFTGGTNDTFVKSYPGSTAKLETTSIVGTNGTVSVSQVEKTAVTATNTVFGTDTTASKITTSGKTATNLVLDTPTTASKATAGTAMSLAKAASSATNVSYIGNASTSSILENATVTNEVLTFGAVSVAQGSVTGTNGTESVTPYTFADVTVPVVTSNTTVNFDAVASNTDVTVPVVTSNNEVSADQVTITNVNAAKVASSATVVATGQTVSSDANGDDVLVGLGTATTATAVTGIGTGTAQAQTITVGTNDNVTVAKYGDLSVTVA